MRTLLGSLEKSLREKERELIKLYTLSLFAIILIAFVFYFPFFHVIGSLDKSLPWRFYLWIRPSKDLTEKDRQIRTYRYVEAYVGDLDYPPIRRKGVLYFIKKVVCFPGDFLLAEKGEFYCNGRLIAVAHPKSPSPPITFSGIVPQGYYFLLGTHRFSFDSRYIGLISSERITGVLLPLF